MVIINRDGVDALTVRSLVDESGVSNGSVYHHLGSLDRLLSLVADEAIRIWAEAFLSALHGSGYASAAAADLAWSRAHPGLAGLVETNGWRGDGVHSQHFVDELRAWLDAERLALAAPMHIVTAVLIGPLAELRRLERHTGRHPTKRDFAVLQVAVTGALAALTV